MTRTKTAVACALGVVVALLAAIAILLSARVHEAVSVADEQLPSKRNDTFKYTLGEPTEVFVLPSTLMEVSGLTDVSPSEVGCVQDEDGVIFIYDLALRRVTRSIRFAEGGDYEGLTAVGNSFFVLRSDGLLYEVLGTESSLEPVVHEIELPARNNEGLGFDKRNNRLLLAPKSRLGKGKEFKNKRAIFAFDLQRRVLLPHPVLEIDTEDVLEFARSGGLPVPVKRKKKGGVRTALRLMPSSVAVHPITDDIYVLSAVDGVLTSFNASGTVTAYALLDPELFRQPEGITFLTSGDMLIANEGQGQKPTLLLFKWCGAFSSWPRRPSTPWCNVGSYRPSRFAASGESAS